MSDGRSRDHRVRGMALLVAVLVCVVIPGYAIAADEHAAGHAADLARFQHIEAKMSPSDPHATRGMAALDARDLAFLGLKPGHGACAGLYQAADPAKGSACTHGLDLPVDADAAAADRTLAACQPYQGGGCPAPAGWSQPTRIPCYTTGPFVDVLYLYFGTSHYTASKERLRRAVAAIDRLFDISARSTTGTDYVRHVRWHMDASCHVRITPVQLPNSIGSDLFSIKDYLVGHGTIAGSAKYLGFVDNGGCTGGIGEVNDDTSAGQTNDSNQGGSLALSYGCFESYDPYAGFGATIGAHELMHTLGAVKRNAPHSTGGHCWDDAPAAHLGADIMCYDDGYSGTFVAACPQTYPESFDCKKDDYYNPAPASGSYLAKYWDTARSRFLASTEPTSWDNLAKPTVTFKTPSTTSGPVGGGTPAALTVDDRGVGIDRVAWTVNGSPVISGPDTSLGLQTAKDQDGGYANGTQLTFGATVTDAGHFSTTVSRTGIVANPYVRLVSPSAQSVIAGAFDWSATAAAVSGRTVKSVQLVVNGTPVGTPDTTSPYGGTYDPALSASAGEVILMVAARIVDSAGVTRETPWRQVTRVVPTLTWRAPSDYADQFAPFPAQAGTTAHFRTDASTLAPGGINRVIFRVDGVTAATDYSAPYLFDYRVPASGQTHTITARAVDAKGVYATSDGLTIVSTTAHAATTFTQPASDGLTLSGSTTFGLSGASSFDQACLVLDTQITNCLDPGTETSLTADLSQLTPGAHVAHWQLAWYDASFAYHETRGPWRTFTVAGSSPTIALTKLTPGQRVSAKQSVGAIVSGLPAGVSVFDVTFLDGTNQIGMDWDPAYYVTWDPKNDTDGPLTLRAIAHLSDGSTVRTSVDVVVANFSARVTGPASGATVGGTITLSATGTADTESVAEAATFLLDGAVIARDRAAPFSVPWNSTTVADGSHSLTMKIQLNDGRTATTGGQTLIVDNTP